MRQIYLYILVALSYTVSGQQADSTQEVNHHKKLTKIQQYMVAGIIAHQAANLVIQYNWWWRGQEKAFNVEDDTYFTDYSLGADKLGHFYTSYYYCHALNELLTLADFNTQTKSIVSITLPALWAVSIEMGDGFSTVGFSTRDLASNMLGLGLAVLQQRYKPLQNIKVKLGYYPTSPYFDNNFKNWSLSGDYGGHIYWLTFQMHNLVSENYKRFFPPYLNLAIGYGVDNYGEYATDALSRKFCIGLDWNLGAIKTKNKYVKTARNIIDYIHLPAPGIIKRYGKATQLDLLLLR